jgi:hypothetical protein
MIVRLCSPAQSCGNNSARTPRWNDECGGDFDRRDSARCAVRNVGETRRLRSGNSQALVEKIILPGDRDRLC